MAVSLRLQRIGKPHQPYYRVVAIDKRRGPHGKPLEVLGSYDPSKEKGQMQLKQERVDYWIKNGAKPTDTVASFLPKSKS